MSKGFFKNTVNYNSFLAEDDISYYLLGAYMTDGCISSVSKNSYEVSITSADQDWLEKIRDIIVPTKPISKNQNTSEFYFGDQIMAEWLISYGCTPKKSRTIRLIKDIPSEYHRDFIRGLVDGDGSISVFDYKKIKKEKEYWYKNTTVYICGISPEFLEDIQKIIPEDIKCFLTNVGKRKDHFLRGKLVHANYDCYRLIFNGKAAIKLLNWLYYDGNKISLPRKEKLSQTAMVGSIPKPIE